MDEEQVRICGSCGLPIPQDEEELGDCMCQSCRNYEDSQEEDY